MPNVLKYRGVIEGFYGPMWSHEERFLYRLPASLVEYAKKLVVSEKDDKAEHRR